MAKRQMIVLTMSYKQGGYCLAGIDPVSGKWMRLVTENGGAVSKNYCKSFNLRDCIEVEIISSAATEIQPENLLLDESFDAHVVEGDVSFEVIKKIHPLEKNKNIFGRWRNYEIDKKYIAGRGSLTIIEAENVVIVPTEDGKAANLNFDCLGMKYSGYRITDRTYRNISQTIILGKAILVVSMGENFPFKKNDGTGSDRYYKFVATIYPL